MSNAGEHTENSILSKKKISKESLSDSAASLTKYLSIICVHSPFLPLFLLLNFKFDLSLGHIKLPWSHCSLANTEQYNVNCNWSLLVLIQWRILHFLHHTHTHGTHRSWWVLFFVLCGEHTMFIIAPCTSMVVMALQFSSSRLYIVVGTIQYIISGNNWLNDLLLRDNLFVAFEWANKFSRRRYEPFWTAMNCMDCTVLSTSTATHQRILLFRRIHGLILMIGFLVECILEHFSWQNE